MDGTSQRPEGQNGVDRYSALLNFGAAPTFVVEKESGRVVGANSEAEDLLGTSVGECLSVCLGDLLPKEAQEKIASFLAQEPGVSPSELLINTEVSPSGHEKSAVRLKLCCDDAGDEAHVIGVVIEHASKSNGAGETPPEALEAELILAALEATADGILIVDLKGKVVFANARFAEMWRIPAEILATRDDDKMIEYALEQLVDPESFLTKVRELYNSKKHTLEILQFKDRRVFERYSRPLLRDEKTEGRVWSFRDVSIRVRAEEALRENEEKYRRIFECVQDAYYETNLEGVILELSPSIRLHTGYTPEELIGQSMMDFYADPEKRAEFVDTLQRDGAVNDYEIVLLDKEGNQIPYSVTSRLQCDDNGEAIKIVGSLRNITERKRAEEGIRNSQQRLSILVEQSPLAVIVWNTDFEVVDWNPAAEEIFGYTKEEALGVYGPELVVPEEVRPQVDDVYRDLMSQTGGYRSTNENVTKDGRRILCEWYNKPLTDDAGNVIAISSFAQDVTESRRAEADLRVSEEKYRSILDNIDEAYYEVDGEGNMTFFNEALCHLLGVPAEKVSGMNNREYMDKETAKRVHAAFRGLYETGMPIKRLEYDIIRANGERRAVETSIVLARDDAGNPSYFRGIVRDVSERKAAEERLRNSEEKYRTLVENINDTIFTLDPNGRFTYISPAVERFAQFKSDEIIGKRFEDFVHPDDLESVRASFAETLGDNAQPMEFRVIAKDGSVRHIRTSSRPIVEDGELVGVTGIMLDISQRKETEEAYRASQQMLRLVLDTTPVRIFWKDREGNYLGCNLHFARDAGLSSPDEIVGKDDYDLSWKEQADLYRADDRMVMETGVPKIDYEEPQSRSDGTRLVLQTSKVPLKDADGNVVGVLAMYQDITERKQAEEERRGLQLQIQQAQKLESLGVLAGGIAHDFNNLLTGMLGYTGLARLGLDKESPVQRHITEIERVANRASDLTQQMLAYSGKGKFVVRPLNLSCAIDELTHLLRASISKKAMLRYEFQANIPSILADATQIQQIAMNLITNASDALENERGAITVRTGTVSVDAGYLLDAFLDTDLPDGEYVFMEVTDTGCGMDQETLSCIFDPFFTTKFTGRGLGLAAVLGIVRGHDGTVKITSVPGEGTSIRVIFPPVAEGSTEASPVQEENTESVEAFTGEGTILVVDDERVVRELASAILSSVGFSVLTADDGREGVEVFRDHSDDIVAVLLDLTMPNLDGEETFKELQAVREDVPVILSSGYNEQEVVSRFDGEGLSGFIQKPYQMEKLLDKIREVLGG